MLLSYLFDKARTNIIDHVFKRFKEEKICHMGLIHELKVKSHITLTRYEYINSKIVKKRLYPFCNTNKSLKIQISSIGYFPSE